METNKENLRELIEKFMDPQNAQMYLDDIEAGERILHKYPAPKPDDMLLANIKANIALQKTQQRTVTFRKRVLEAIAVAASIIIIAAISLQSIDKTPDIEPGETFTTHIFIPKWSFMNENPTDMLNEINDIDQKFTQAAMDTTNYSYDSALFDEYNDEIQQLENRLNNIGSTQEEYTYTNINDSSIFKDIEDLENRFNEIHDGFQQEDYSNYDALDI